MASPPQLGFTEHQHFVTTSPDEQIGAITSGIGIREVHWGAAVPARVYM
jgi:hypothetical protein